MTEMMKLMESAGSRVLFQLFNTLGHYCMNGLMDEMRDAMINKSYLSSVMMRIVPE